MDADLAIIERSVLDAMGRSLDTTDIRDLLQANASTRVGTRSPIAA
jgi:hypothetical protein